MDEFDFIMKHLESWMDRIVFNDEKYVVKAGIMAYLYHNPEVISFGWSWAEIRKVAEREGYMEPNKPNTEKIIGPQIRRRKQL